MTRQRPKCQVCGEGVYVAMFSARWVHWNSLLDPVEGLDDPKRHKAVPPSLVRKERAPTPAQQDELEKQHREDVAGFEYMGLKGDAAVARYHEDFEQGWDEYKNRREAL